MNTNCTNISTIIIWILSICIIIISILFFIYYRKQKRFYQDKYAKKVKECQGYYTCGHLLSVYMLRNKDQILSLTDTMLSNMHVFL